ncbi:membrane protein insertion efficiency factor YidD [Patescibacteria group bacterium]|nr:membrane protein insertion efficiency factor YidD [Patescibacteria group bacterium]
MIKKINHLIRLPFLCLIRFYQQTFSLDHGLFKRYFPYGYCRFHPTCSDYSYQAIDKYGIFKGGVLGFWRILRCNPWNPGGEDPLI